MNEPGAGRFSTPDRLLQLMAVEADRQKKEFPIVVAVAGVVLAGTVISAETYLRESGLDALWEPPSTEEPATEQEYAEDFKQAKYLHLRVEATYPPGLKNLLWRCRLEEVSAFSITAWQPRS